MENSASREQDCKQIEISALIKKDGETLRTELDKLQDIFCGGVKDPESKYIEVLEKIRDLELVEFMDERKRTIERDSKEYKWLELFSQYREEINDKMCKSLANMSFHDNNKEAILKQGSCLE